MKERRPDSKANIKANGINTVRSIRTLLLVSRQRNWARDFPPFILRSSNKRQQKQQPSFWRWWWKNYARQKSNNKGCLENLSSSSPTVVNFRSSPAASVSHFLSASVAPAQSPGAGAPLSERAISSSRLKNILWRSKKKKKEKDPVVRRTK